MKKILVTGAAGFIGSHVSESLLKRGDSVHGVDELNDFYDVANKKKNLDILRASERFTFSQVDIRNPRELEAAVENFKPTHIAHIAARAGVRPSLKDPTLYTEVNVLGTLNLLELARKYSVENFVLTSSSSVYGNCPRAPFKEHDTATDSPISPYAATKKAAEVLGYTYHHLYQLNVNVVRPFTVYGPRGRPDMAPWLFVQAALSGKPIRKFGDGSTRRDYTFIADFVAGFVSALDRPLGYEIFNLGNSQTVSLSEAIEIVSRVTGRPLAVQQEAMQPGDVTLTSADITKAKRLLDYDPQTSFEEGMTRFAEWFRSR